MFQYGRLKQKYLPTKRSSEGKSLKTIRLTDRLEGNFNILDRTCIRSDTSIHPAKSSFLFFIYRTTSDEKNFKNRRPGYINTANRLMCIHFDEVGRIRVCKSHVVQIETITLLRIFIPR